MSIKRILVAVVTLAIALAVSGVASAYPDLDPLKGLDPDPVAGMDPCLVNDPDATLTFGSGVPSVGVTGRGDDFDGCNDYIVDLAVPSTSSGGPGYDDAFSISVRRTTTLKSEGVCEYYSFQARVYQRGGTTVLPTMTFLGRISYYGEWLAPGFCRLSRTTSSTPWPSSFNPPWIGTKHFRIVAREGAWDPWSVNWETGGAPKWFWWTTSRVEAEHLPA